MTNRTLKSTVTECKSILDSWDDYVIISLSGQSLCDSFCIPLDDIVLEGRCKDFTALKRKNVLKSAVGRKNKEKFHGHHDALHRFVCLKRCISPVVATSLTESVTVKITSLSDLNPIYGPNLFAKTESFGVQEMVKWLNLNGVSVIFCSDSIDDDVVHIVACEGISVVSRNQMI